MFGRNKNKQQGAGNKSGVPLNPFGKPSHNGNQGQGQGGQGNGNNQGQGNGNGNGGQGQGGGGGGGGGAPDANQQMMQFMKDQGLFDGVDMGKFAEAVRNGNAEDATAIFTHAMANSVRVAVIGAQRISQQAVARAVEEATNNATGRTTRELGLRELRAQLPFASQEASAPMVEGIYDQFLENGLDADTAVSNTIQYFEEQAKMMGKHFGMMEKPVDNTQLGGRGFGNTPSSFSTQNNINGTGDDDDVYDFVAALTSGQSTFEDLNSPVQRVEIVNDGGQGGGNGNQGDGSGGQGNAAA